MKTILFFEITDYALLRFPRWMADEFIKKDSTINFMYIYLDKYKRNKFSLKELELSNNSKIIDLKGNIKNIDPILKQYSKKQSSLITMALRPPEFYVLSKANTLGMETNLVQHGIFIPFMKREVSYFYNEIKKLWGYLKSTFYLSKLTNVSFNKLLKEIFLIYIKGDKNISNSMFVKLNIIPNRTFVYAEYWAQYFHREYGILLNSCIYMGTPDLEFLDDTLNKKKEKAACYICQTLVEDGRLSEELFKNFIKELANSLPDQYIFYLKFHPRTDQSLYEELLNRNETLIIKDELPHCEKYIGHYSTLLSLPLNITSNVMLWEFEGHEIPEYFKDATSFVTNDKEELKDFIKNSIDNKLDKSKVEFYFGKGNLNPFKRIINIVLNEN